MEKARKYTGASYGPLAEDWYATGASAKAEVRTDITTLRNRMRELVRNDGFAFAAVQALANNIVGKGIRASVSGKKKEKVERVFLNWCSSLQADFNGRLNFYGLQQLLVKGMAESGDVLILKRYTGKGKNAQLSLQILESDYLVNWYNAINVEGKPQGTYVVDGIYFDKNDNVIGYELYKQHPGDNIRMGSSYEHFFVSSDDCILLFRPERPGQHRGVPVAHSVMLEHKMLNQYELAQAHRQTIAASFAAFITTTNTAEFGGAIPKPTNERDYPNMTGERSIQYLLPGENIALAQPPSVDGYDEYTRSRLRKMAKGWGLSYEVLSGDLSNVNFSSGRMGWIEMHRNIESWQNLVLMPKFCSVIWNWWVELEQLKGTIPMDLAGLTVDWTAPRREMIDPVKETKAMIEQIQSGLKSYPDAIRELGGDPEMQMLAIEESDKMITEKKLVLSSDYRNIQAQKMKTSSSGSSGDGL
jgi:lambda family phage portal protein